MYNIKANKETKELQIIKEEMNVHSSIIDKKTFDDVFTREFARFEYFALLAKSENGKTSDDDETKLTLLADTFKFDHKTVTNTVYDGLHEELKPLMVLTLYAHGKLLKSYEEKTEEEDASIKSVVISLGLSDFYKQAKTLVQSIENGSITLDSAVNELKPFYNSACSIINHNAVENVCKKWEESTKEKNTRAFIVGLLSKYKLTRYNKIKAESPLKSQATFEKYFAMWLVSEGVMNDNKKNNVPSIETFDSFCGRLTAQAKKKTTKK